MDDVYGDAGEVEAEFDSELDKSLDPRGPDSLELLVASLDLPAASQVLDLGCRDGWYSIELARRYGFVVLGIDPVQRHVANGERAVSDLRATEPDVASRVRLERGAVERIPAADGSLDLIWCRDVLVHVADLEAAFAECARVLRSGGHMVIYQMFATEWLTPAEADRLWPPAGIVGSSTDPTRFEAAATAAGFRVSSHQELKSEWREYLEERREMSTGRQLLHAARLLREPDRYVAKFGEVAYGVMLTDCLWGVYQMIGKLSPRSYVLQR